MYWAIAWGVRKLSGPSSESSTSRSYSDSSQATTFSSPRLSTTPPSSRSKSAPSSSTETSGMNSSTMNALTAGVLSAIGSPLLCWSASFAIDLSGGCLRQRLGHALHRRRHLRPRESLDHVLPEAEAVELRVLALAHERVQPRARELVGDGDDCDLDHVGGLLARLLDDLRA